MNYKIANLSLLCAILVVTIHIGPLRDGFGSGWWFRQLVGNGLASFAVSYFFCVSGFMLAKHTRETGWWTAALKKRFITIFVPLLCAIGLNLALNAPMMCLGDLVAQRPYGASIWNLKYCLTDILCLTIAPHLGRSFYPQLFLKYTVGDTYSAAASVFKIVVTVILSVLLAMLMRKILPRVSAICFGGR